MEGVESLPCLTACYLIDSHLNFDKHLEIARRFRCVFVAQKAYVPRFKEAGLELVHWLPLGCDPGVHRKFEGDKSFEVSFVGSVTDLNRRRNALLLRLAERFPLHVDRCFLEEMARTFSRSKIVFNRAIQSDLNMRVFEAMATGSLLVTDEAPGSGLTDLFEDGKHLVLYRSEAELYERVAHYLRNDLEREGIAAAGRKEVLRRHTYEHRAREMIEVIEPLLARPSLAGGATRDIVVCNPGATHFAFPRHTAREGNRTMAFQKETTEVSARLRDYYKKERCDLAALIPEGAERILDIGCGGGHLGKLLKEQSDRREIWGVECHPQAFEEARRWLDQVFLADASQWEPPVGKGYFDVLVLADVLEHLLDPKAVLERYLAWLKPAGSVVMSIPNVRFWGVVKHLVDGYWTYQDEGLLDRDHVRFFTWAEIERLMASCGLEVAEVRWNLDDRCPQVPEGKTVDLQLGRMTLHGLEPDELRDFFVFQYLVRGARSRERLLTDARQLEASGRGQEAFGLYASLAARDEVEPGLVRKLAQLWTTAEERQRASSMLEECLRLHPAHPELLVTSARMLAEDRQVDAARQRLERVLLFLPEHGEARRLLDALSKGHSIL
jgi:2-polyprenyl-3-methyl-5-hydroxy-6-metoxy-1,4-benzoquinol methylase